MRNTQDSTQLKALKKLIRVAPMQGTKDFFSFVEGFEAEFGFCSGFSNYDAGHAMELYLEDHAGSPNVVLAGLEDN